MCLGERRNILCGSNANTHDTAVSLIRSWIKRQNRRSGGGVDMARKARKFKQRKHINRKEATYYTATVIRLLWDEARRTLQTHPY